MKFCLPGNVSLRLCVRVVVIVFVLIVGAALVCAHVVAIVFAFGCLTAIGWSARMNVILFACTCGYEFVPVDL